MGVAEFFAIGQRVFVEPRSRIGVIDTSVDTFTPLVLLAISEEPFEVSEL